MWELIHKLLLLFIERKDKYKHAEEKLQRRVDYFKELKTLEDSNLDEDEKRARRNAIAQRLVGSQLVSFELVDYLIKNKNINNFEIVAKTLALWDTSLKIDRNDDKKITGIGLNTWGFRKEKLMLIITLLFSIFMIVFSIYIFKYNVIWLKSAMMLPEYISIIAMVLLVLGFIALAIFLCITTIILFDLKRIIELMDG